MFVSIKEETQEFAAKYLCDMSKAIAAVGLASSFFKGMPWFWRISLIIIALVFLIISVIIIEKKGDKK